MILPRPLGMKQFLEMHRTYSQMKTPRNGVAHLKMTIKTDLDIGKHTPQTSDPDTLIKVNPSRARTGPGCQACTAGNCPVRNLQQP